MIPQLIARIDTPRALVGRLIHHLLIDIGKHHPQALVYPLTVASKSASMARRNAANKILKNMCEHSPVLVQQAVMVTSLHLLPTFFHHLCQQRDISNSSVKDISQHLLYFNPLSSTGISAWVGHVVTEPSHLFHYIICVHSFCIIFCIFSVTLTLHLVSQ